MGQDIVLTDGTILNVKINFLTVYLLQKNNVEKLMAKAKKNKSYETELAAIIIYCIIRSAGKKVTFDEALILTPIDENALRGMIEEFINQFEKYKKKQTHKM